MADKFYHSVFLLKDRCAGCIHCLKRCPTYAIRVRNGKASIISEFCIDCGECIMHCPHNAKETKRDRLQNALQRFDYSIALVDPSIYGQFNNISDVNIILTSLLHLGFDDVFEVGRAFEYSMERAQEYIREHPDIRPVINSSCPSIERLIRVRFPSLIKNILPFIPPTEIAARAALKTAVDKTGLSEDRIGIIYIAPCPAQVSFVKAPIGLEKQTIDCSIAFKDIYPDMLNVMQKAALHPQKLSQCSTLGLSMGTTCSEAKSLGTRHYLAADGIENVIRVLNDIEDGKITHDLVYAELKGCPAGCVGGVLNVENPHYARAKIKQLEKQPSAAFSNRTFFEEQCGIEINWTVPMKYEPVFRLGDDIFESMSKMNRVESILKTLPQLDCGSCGAPTCRTLAEDIVRGSKGASRDNCIYMLRGFYSKMKQENKKNQNNTPDNSISDEGGQDHEG